MKARIILTLSLAALLLPGCVLNGRYERPKIETPAGWQAAGPPDSARPGWPEREWWQVFRDTTLNQLEQSAQTGNYDIHASASQLAQALASARIAGATLYPTVDAKLIDQRIGRLSGRGHESALTAQLNAVYDLDPWGRSRSLRQAARADVVAASEADLDSGLTVAAVVAATYFQLAAFDERIDLSHESIETAQRVEALVEARYRAGAVSELDWAQSRTSLDNFQAGLPPLEQGRLQTIHALAVLIGRNPEDLAVQPPPLTRIALPDTLPTGVPAELLQRRPDIRRAEAKLAAAHADIGVARASLFPDILLTGQGGYASDQLSTLIRDSSGTFAVGATVLAPIFHGGSLRAELDRSKARYEELVSNYHQTVLDALREVEDSLVAVQKLTEQERALMDAEREGKRSFELAEIRYRAGAIDAIIMLDAQNVWLGLRNSVLQTRLARISALVSLYRALGGGMEQAGTSRFD